MIIRYQFSAYTLSCCLAVAILPTLGQPVHGQQTSQALPEALPGELDDAVAEPAANSSDRLLDVAATALSSADQALGQASQAVANAAQATRADAKDASSKFNALVAGLSIFVLAVFVGFEVITKVPPTLHTPLMSGSNAISGITLVGALLVAGRSDYASLLGALAVVFATINVIGGFWVTHRMLSMFKR